MYVGDLVRDKKTPPHLAKSYGIVVKIIDQFVIGVLWGGYDVIFVEPIRYLEVVNAGR